MEKVDEFVEYLYKENVKPHEIKNILTYYVAALWSSSYAQRKNDAIQLEESKCTTK